MRYAALGRLVGVTEPGVTTTTYTYDVLGNLENVSQTDTATNTTQTRTFHYDSLNCLTSATNPESGTIAYTYDANGNLASKTDQRGAITCFGSLSGNVCAGDGYDSLNRLTQVNYYTASTTAAATPAVRYCYDGYQYANSACSSSQLANHWLRRTGAGNANSWTNFEFDLAGRVKKSYQYVAGISQPYVFSYTYYNDDAPASITYPSLRKVVSCYDANGRLTWVSANALATNCTASPTTYAGAGTAYGIVSSYAPTGAVKTLTLGNGLVETSSFNSRLQLTSLVAAKSGTSRLELGLSFCSTATTASCTTNNGNLLWQTIKYPQSSSETALSLTQQYLYDTVNRLTKATEAGLEQSYGYDGFGNRYLSTNTFTATGTQTSAVLDSAHNRLYGLAYDLGGSGNHIDVD